MMKPLITRLLQIAHPHRPAVRDFHSHDDYRIEPLEDRQMLAGQVNVLVSGNNITINGDNASNDVMIVEAGAFIRVLGLDNEVLAGDVDADGFTTVPNGQLNNLTVRLRGGDDTLRAGLFAAPPEGADADGVQEGFKFDVLGTTRVIAGSGADEIQLIVAELHGNVILNMGAGNDDVTFRNTVVQGNLRAIAGSGDDTAQADNLTANGNVIYRGGGGADRLELGFDQAVTFGGSRADLRMGGGNDTLLVGELNGNAATTIFLHGNGGDDSRNDFLVGTATILSFENVIV